MIREFPTATIEAATSARRRRAGFTLLEGLVASVILAILVLGVAGSLSAAYQESQATTANATAVILARQLADEIVSRPFDGTVVGQSGPRSAFTDIGNYNNYSDNSTSIPSLGEGTVDVTGADSYRRTVSVVQGAMPSIDSVSPTTDFAIVTVSVTCPNGQVVSIPEWVANYSIQSN
jgi:prepilin-type N-terminal cleavage/methylation domain-containing protein